MWERPWMPHANIAAYIFTPHIRALERHPRVTTDDPSRAFLRWCWAPEPSSWWRQTSGWPSERHTRASVNWGWSAWGAQATMHAWGFHLISLIFDVNTSLMSDLQAEELWVTHQSCRRMLNTCNYCLWVVYMPRGGNISISEWHSSRPLTSQGSQVQIIGTNKSSTRQWCQM